MTWIQFSSGLGPAECRLAVAGISRRFQEACGGEVVASVEDDDGNGFSSILLSVDDTAPYADWIGSAEWVCKSPLRPNHGRKRWYVGISLLKPVEATDKRIAPDLLEWSAMRASGPGGQHVNKTESAIRLKHLPTGLTVTAREERSQHRNRSLALSKLVALLDANVQSDQSSAEKDAWTRHHQLVRGNPVKTFKGEDFAGR